MAIVVGGDGGPWGRGMVSDGPSIDSDIGAGAGAGRRAQSGTGLNNNNMTNYFVYHPAVASGLMIAYNAERRLSLENREMVTRSLLQTFRRPVMEADVTSRSIIDKIKLGSSEKFHILSCKTIQKRKV